jgi:hypothetical protein
MTVGLRTPGARGVLVSRPMWHHGDHRKQVEWQTPDWLRWIVTFRLVSSSKVSLASGGDRASRSSLSRPMCHRLSRRRGPGVNTTGMFTHFPYAVRYWPAQQEGPFNPRIIEDVFRQVMRDLAGTGRALELNIGGALYGHGSRSGSQSPSTPRESRRVRCSRTPIRDGPFRWRPGRRPAWSGSHTPTRR